MKTPERMIFVKFSNIFISNRNAVSRYVLFFAVLLVLFGVGAAETAGAAAKGRAGWPAHLRFLSGPNGGQWFVMGGPIAEALSKSVLPTSSRIGGGVENIDSVNRKNGDIAFTLNCFLGVSGSGEAEYKDIKLDNVAILANIYPQVLYVLIRKDFAEKNGIDSVEKLLAKKMPVRFASLKPGTASEFILSLLLKYGYGTDFEKLGRQGWNISFNNYAETADNLVAGELDCFAYTAGTDVPLIHTIEEHTDVMILPIDKKVLDKLSAKFKTGSYTIKAGAYKSAKKPILTLGDYTCIIVRKDFPNDLVSEIARTLWDDREKITKAVADFGGLSAATAVPKGLPVHPGAANFWKSLPKAK